MTDIVREAEGHVVRKAVTNCDYQRGEDWRSVACEVAQFVGAPNQIRVEFYTSRRSDDLRERDRARADVGVSSPEELDALIEALVKARDLAHDSHVFEESNGAGEK